jgi:hypothetical protein
MNALERHLSAVRENAIAEAERLLADAGDEPSIAVLSAVEAYLSDADRAERLLRFLESRKAQQPNMPPDTDTRPTREPTAERSIEERLERLERGLAEIADAAWSMSPPLRNSKVVASFVNENRARLQAEEAAILAAQRAAQAEQRAKADRRGMLL